MKGVPPALAEGRVVVFRAFAAVWSRALPALPHGSQATNVA
jgi:hypothetical protein